MDPTTIQLLIAVTGAVGGYAGAYSAVKSALAVLEQRMKTVEAEIASLRESRHHVAERVDALQLELLRLHRKDNP